MFNSLIIDLVILLSFLYFSGSLVISAINEAIAGISRLRQGYLKMALDDLLFEEHRDPAKPVITWKSFVDSKLLKSPHIQSLMRVRDEIPAYIPAKNFVLAVIQEIGAKNYNTTALPVAFTNVNIPPLFTLVLEDLYAQSGGNLPAFEKNLEEFYNNAMDRVGGVYKKVVRRYLFFIALILAIALNLDTLGIAGQALQDKNKLSLTTDKIVSQLSNIKMNKDSSFTVSVSNKDGQLSVAGKEEAKKDIADKGKKPEILTVKVEDQAGYSLGYKGWCDFAKQWQEHWFYKLLGVLITAFALQLSSNFWFDLMNKAVNVRAVGKKPETNQKDTTKP